MSTPAERIRRFMTDAFYRSDTTANDALAALAELERERERERDELRETVRRLNRRAQALEAGIAEKIASHPPGSMGRALANAAAEMYHSRAQKAETERDELRARLSEIEDFARFVVRNEEDVTPRRAMIVQGEEIARLRKRLAEVWQRRRLRG